MILMMDQKSYDSRQVTRTVENVDAWILDRGPNVRGLQANGVGLEVYGPLHEGGQQAREWHQTKSLNP